MTEHHMKFVPSLVRHYSHAEPPAMLPITLNGHEVGKAIYYDGRYSFFLSEKLEAMLGRGVIELRFVYGDDMGRESWACRPGADLIRIQVEPQENAAGSARSSRSAPADDILDI
jgi:hypothetical protein